MPGAAWSLAAARLCRVRGNLVAAASVLGMHAHRGYAGCHGRDSFPARRPAPPPAPPPPARAGASRALAAGCCSSIGASNVSSSDRAGGPRHAHPASERPYVQVLSPLRCSQVQPGAARSEPSQADAERMSSPHRAMHRVRYPDTSTHRLVGRAGVSCLLHPAALHVASVCSPCSVLHPGDPGNPGVLVAPSWRLNDTTLPPPCSPHSHPPSAMPA